MEIRYPDYYKKFHCIAGDCPDTCCAGWEIPVDRNSEKRYRLAQKTIENRVFAEKLKKYIKGGRILSEDVTCPFLDSAGLCEMYQELGPEALCRTCARHPRHLEDYGNLHEIILLLSCPEAARLILEENGDGFYVRNIPEKQGNTEGIDEEMLNLLLQIRNLIWSSVKDPKYSADANMAFSLALVHDVQRRINPGHIKYEEIASVLGKYRQDKARERFFFQWKSGAKERFLLMSDFMEELASLDIICREWPERLEQTRVLLYHSEDSRTGYEKKRKVFCESMAEAEDDFRRIFSYYIYSFFLTGLYDGDILSKIKMAVLCTMAVEELYLAQWCSGDMDVLSPKMRSRICHELARQMENSDENRAGLERLLKCDLFASRRIVDALL